MKHAGLMLEFVATRDIQEGDEIFLNYGDSWEAAWLFHVSKWQRDYSKQEYSYAHLFDNETKVIKTQREQHQQNTFYPDNLFTSCYYNYRKKNGHFVRWGESNTTFWDTYLRPCEVIDRKEDPQGKMLYTVVMRNRYGLSESERIPKGERHIVSDLPRQAIRFTNKIYTTDQHMENAFRHEITLPDDIFPLNWIDRN